MIRVAVHGATGRMGKLLLQGVQAAPDLELAWACGREEPENWAADVLIDFSTPAGLQRVLERASCPVVSGTTGGVLPSVTHLPLLHAANFSLGIALLGRLVEQAARVLPDFDVEIVEYHHSGKKDAPSGTALRLAGAVQKGRALEMPLSHGRMGPRQDGHPAGVPCDHG